MQHLYRRVLIERFAGPNKDRSAVRASSGVDGESGRIAFWGRNDVVVDLDLNGAADRVSETGTYVGAAGSSARGPVEHEVDWAYSRTDGVRPGDDAIAAVAATYDIVAEASGDRIVAAEAR